MTPEAAKQLSDLVIGMTIAFVIAVIICWYFVPHMVAGLSTVFAHKTQNTEQGTKKSSTPTLRRTALRVAEHRYRIEQLSRKRRVRTTRTSSEPGPNRTAEPRDITGFRPLDDEQRSHACWLMEQGWSNNKIYSIFKGTRTKRMAELSELRSYVETEQLAKAIADPSVRVPDMEPLPA